MKTILLGLLASGCLVAGAAQAADLPVRQPQPIYVAPVFTWTGFYVGGQIGGAWGSSQIAGLGYSASGVVGGLYGGYNQQFGSFVLGAEGDIEASSASGSMTFPGAFFRTSAPWQGSLRARAGVTFDRALFYATGGVAFANIRTEGYLPPLVSTASTTRAGWTLGLGVEYALTNNWLVRAEYRYADYGRFNADFFGLGVANTRFSQQAVRVGIAYKFGSPAAAVVARY